MSDVHKSAGRKRNRRKRKAEKRARAERSFIGDPVLHKKMTRLLRNHGAKGYSLALSFCDSTVGAFRNWLPTRAEWEKRSYARSSKVKRARNKASVLLAADGGAAV